MIFTIDSLWYELGQRRTVLYMQIIHLCRICVESGLVSVTSSIINNNVEGDMNTAMQKRAALSSFTTVL